MEMGIWAAVAVAFAVLVKVLWDIYQNNQAEASERVEPALVEGVDIIDGIPVVPRSQRRHLPKVEAIEPVLKAHDLAQPFVANEELETVKLMVKPVAQTTTNVVQLAERKTTKAAVVEEEVSLFDDEFIDTVAMSSSQSKVVEAQDYIVIYVTAGRVPFDGERLLKYVSNYGLRFGEMGMFHRHEHPNGHGQVLFSMARVDDVGAFDLEAMGSEFISAVTLFMALPNHHPYVAYDTMIDTAKRLAHEFCGQVLDQNQNPLNRQLIEHYREQVVEFTRHHLMSKAI